MGKFVYGKICIWERIRTNIYEGKQQPYPCHVGEVAPEKFKGIILGTYAEGKGTRCLPGVLTHTLIKETYRPILYMGKFVYG